LKGRLEGKIALVTGAAQGIGRQTVLAFAREGARVWATSRTAAKMKDLKELPGVRVLEMDVTDRDQVQAAAREIGAVDVLVNCAGIVPGGSIASCPPEVFQRTFDVNVAGTYFVMKTFIAGMAEKSAGSIINIASVISSVSAVPDRFAYGMSKAALIGMTKSVAADYMSRGVRCNAVCPGAVDTEGLRERIAAAPDPEAARQAMLQRHPLGRMGTAAEIAAACVYLASDESAFMTGQLLVIDGGLSL
jgi:2-keto-3-deoxy-L-fuconate dehydrogenase